MLCSAAANQKALAHKLDAMLPLSAIGVVDIPKKQRPNWSRRLASISVGLPLRRAWFGMLAHYEQSFPNWPQVPLSRHRGVNSESVLETIALERPDLVLVSGTDLLRQPIIDRVSAHGRIMNLHTGISPYLKGAPNCTAWALALGEFDMIGNTVMWLDAGIDSGNIVASERTRLTGTESLTELQLRVMEHGHDLYSRCVRRFRDELPLPSVRQDEIDPGRLFLSSDWTPLQIARAMMNFYSRYDPATLGTRRHIQLISPEG